MRNRYRVYDVYHARPEDCAACPVSDQCLSKSTATRHYLSIQMYEPEPNVPEEVKAKIDRAESKQIFARRLRIVEPLFANICAHKRMSLFILRSKYKVDVRWRLYAMTYNLGKICVFGAI